MKVTGEWIRSTQETWAASAPLNFDLSFLRRSLGMKFPVIRKAFCRIGANITMAAGNLPGEDGCRILDSFYWKDATGERINLDSENLRVAAQEEFGASKYVDPAASGTTATYECWLPMPIFPIEQKSKRPADFGMPVVETLDYGQLRVTCASATGGGVTNLTVNSGTVEFWMLIVDERKPEAKTRLKYVQQVWTRREEYFPINGGLRSLVGVTPLAAGGYNTWNATTTIDSKDLDYQQFLTSLSRQVYNFAGFPIAASEEVAQNTALEVFGPSEFQKIPDCPELVTCHVLLNAAPVANSFAVCGIIEDRNPDVTARTLGFANKQLMQGALASAGKVKTASGQGSRAVTNWKSWLRKKMPVKLS